MLRCLGGLGIAGRGAGLRHGLGGNGRFSLRGATRVAAGSQRDRPCSHFEKEIDDDHARYDPAGLVRDGLPGPVGLGRHDVAVVADLGTATASTSQETGTGRKVLGGRGTPTNGTGRGEERATVSYRASSGRRRREQSELDQAIATLKKKLAELEAKRARKAADGGPKKSAEIEKAHAEVRRLAEDAQKKEAEAMAARAKLHSAMERLAQLDGGKNLFFKIRVKGLPAEAGQKFLFKQGGPGPSGPNISIRKGPEGGPPVIQFRKGGPVEVEGGQPMILWKQRRGGPQAARIV